MHKSPNLDLVDDSEAEMYWLQFSDFYEWPHIQLFDSLDHLKVVVLPITSVKIIYEHYFERSYTDLAYITMIYFHIKKLMLNSDLWSIHRNMKAEMRLRKKRVETKWCDVIKRIEQHKISL